MRKIVECLTFAVCVAGLGDANAAYVIRLKNGNEFVTGRYWEEGKQVMFDTYGGVFGVDKAFVTKIEQSGKPITLAVAAQEVPQEKPRVETTTEKTEKKVSDKSTAPAAAKKDDDPVQKEFNALKAQFSGLGTMLTDEMSEYLKRLSALKSKIQLDRKINDYISEYAELINMADAAEAALRSRR
jgi:hypothetical protein